MTDPTDDEEYSDDAQRGDQAERIGDAIRDGEIETAVEELVDATQHVVYVEDAEDARYFTGDESNIEAALSAVSKYFDSLDVEILKHRWDTYWGTGGDAGMRSRCTICGDISRTSRASCSCDEPGETEHNHWTAHGEATCEDC